MSTEPRESEGDEEGLPGSAGHFTTEQVAQLNARLDRKLLKQNPDGKTYLEGYTVINTLNRIFGYGSWSREVLARWQEEGHDGDEGILYGATVRLIVTAPDGSQSHHDDDGYCVAPMSRKTSKVSLQSRETARKGAVTDALKRAARSFGEQLANNLYDKGYMAARDADERQAAQAQQPARAQTQPHRRPAPAITEPTGQQQRPTQTNDEAEAAALETHHRRLYNAAQRDQEGKILLLSYLKEQGKSRITEMTMAEATEWLLVFHDREVTPDAPATVEARA